MYLELRNFCCGSRQSRLEFFAVFFVQLNLGEIKFLICSMRVLQLEEREHGVKEVRFQHFLSTRSSKRNKAKSGNVATELR